MSNIFPIDFEEKNTIAQNDYILFSDSQDCNKLKKAQYSNLKGEKGDTGNAATVCVGSTTTGAPGSCACVTNSGDCHNAVFDFTVPQGPQGCKGDTGAKICAAAFNCNDIDFTDTDGCVTVLCDAKTCLKGDKGDPGTAATVCAGTTTTLAAGCCATVSNSGTCTAAVFNFGIPKGDKGDTGSPGNGIACVTSSKAGKVTTVTMCETNGCSYSFCVCDGADGQGAGDVNGPSSACNGHLAVFDGTSGKCIKDGGAIPTPTTVVDSLDSTSTTSALSANQGKVLDGKIADLFGLGKFLSLWDATTGLPDSFPLSTPYTYSTGDYFLVETVSSATPPVNYRPTGSSYTGTASTTTESDELEAGDVYIYDGTTWLLQSNHGKTVSFSNIAGDAMDNANLSGYLNMKAFYLSSTSDLTTAQKAFEWQNGGKTAIIIYNSKPYAFSYYNTASMAFVCLLYREQLEAGNNKTSLVRDVITFSMTGGTTVSSISANARNNIIASVLKTDTDYATPYTPQYDGSPATKKYVDDSIPTDNCQLANSCGYTTCTGTITQICMNGCSCGTSGVVDLGTVGGGGGTFVDALIVGGGGAGSRCYNSNGMYGAGGGGGEVIERYSIPIRGVGCYTVTIGTGGNNNAAAGAAGTSTFFDIYEAHGGKGGCTCSGASTGGQSGGGFGGAGCGACAGGGGGGARASGSGASNCVGGAGGLGVRTYFDGTLKTYGGGGGGHGCKGGGSGMDGGGSGAASYSCNGNTGSCCGGGGGGTGNGTTGKGAGGMVQIRYPVDGSYGITCATGGTVTTACGFTIHTFTSNGTFEIVS